MLYSFLDARGGHRMALGHVGANTENDIGFVHIGERIGHSSAADGSRQPGDGGSVSSSTAVIDLIGAKTGSDKFLHRVSCLRGCAAGGYTIYGMTTVLLHHFFESFGSAVQRNIPIHLG